MAPRTDDEALSDDDLVLPALSYGSSSEDDVCACDAKDETALTAHDQASAPQVDAVCEDGCECPSLRNQPKLPRPPQVLVSAIDASYRVKRFSFEDLSVADFRKHCVTDASPVIITGLAEHMPRCGELGMGLELLCKVLHRGLEVPVRGRGHSTLNDFFSCLGGGEEVYLADVPVARHFPHLFHYVKTPRYFLHCFSHRTRREISMVYDTPALFVGAQGTRSDLHIDNMCSNFWMFLAEGQKHWVTFHRDDAELLSPSFDVGEQIRRFRGLTVLEEESCMMAKLSKARRLEFTLGPGELLFIPWNTPHEVTNLDTTTSFSANFFDQSNIREAIEQGRARLAQRDVGTDRHRNLKAMLDALEEIEWPDVEEDLGRGDDSKLDGEDMLGWFPCHERLKSHTPVSFVVGS
eukprot:TRINITY_DN49788_c0_g1_i1.p1 TRINITY_DN49788_c0_g1~~TRINITY_DN49788_c0_g1_i1.p1  ORF type:complete len:407 (+),score=61.93 TRINITY_DN49788_c0_g1_i1:109-1329(+)